MAELPILPLKVQALLADTLHMTAEEFGAYCRILFTMWAHGGWLPDDDAELRKIAGVLRSNWARKRCIITRPFIRAGGKITQKRLTDTWLKVQDLRRKRAVAGSKGGRPKGVSNSLSNWFKNESNSKATKTKKERRTSSLVEGPDPPPVENPAASMRADPPQEAAEGSKEGKIFVTPQLQKIMAAKLGRGSR